MRQRRLLASERKEPLVIGPLQIAYFVILVIVVIVGVSLLWREVLASRTLRTSVRSSIVLVNDRGDVGVWSYDPNDRQLTEFVLPDVDFRARSVGKYHLSQLYSLGKYEDEPGRYVQRKIQGLLRLPIFDYVVVSEIGRMGLLKSLWAEVWGNDLSHQLSRIDAINLGLKTIFYDYRKISFETMVKNGVFESNEAGEYSVNDSRLQQFVGSVLFDWRVGDEGLTVAVVNETNIEGMGSDIAKFMTNVGMDVVSVRSGIANDRKKTEIRLAYKEEDKLASDLVMRDIFGENVVYVYGQNLDEYRSMAVVLVGEDLIEMF